MVHERAGQPAQPGDLVDVARLVTAYYTVHPDPGEPGQRVAFGTSGHRGSALAAAFNEDHIAATTQAICDYRERQGTDGPVFLGADTHALSEPARITAVEVLAANGVTVLIDSDDGYTPTPAVSHAILTYNRDRKSGLADGIVVTPSHNPPADGGFKYNPPHGGPAGSDATSWIQDRANALIEGGLKESVGSPTPGRSPPTPPGGTTSFPVTSTISRPSSTWTPYATPASGSAPTPWAGPRSRTGGGSPSATGSISRWSTRSPTPPGVS